MTQAPATRRTHPAAPARSIAALALLAAGGGLAVGGGLAGAGLAGPSFASEAAEAPPPAAPAPGAISDGPLASRRNPTHLALSPDGRRVAFVLEIPAPPPALGGATRRVHLWDPEGGPIYRLLKEVGIGDGPAPARHRPVTRDTEDATRPAFSPDGRRLAFLSARGEGALPQVWMLPLDGGEAERWTDSSRGVREYAWGPDGEIVYLTDLTAERGAADPSPRTRSFWRVPPGGGPAELLDSGDPGIRDFCLSRNGRRLAWVSNGKLASPSPESVDLFLHDRDTGETRRLVDRPGGERSPCFSHDGERVFYVAAADTSLRSAPPHGPKGVWEVRVEDGSRRLLTPRLERPVHDITAAPKADRILAVLGGGADSHSHLARIVPGSRNVYVVHSDPGHVSDVVSNGDGRKAFFVHRAPGTGPELASWAFDDDYIQVLTTINAEAPPLTEPDALPNANEEDR